MEIYFESRGTKYMLVSPSLSVMRVMKSIRIKLYNQSMDGNFYVLDRSKYFTPYDWIEENFKDVAYPKEILTFS